MKTPLASKLKKEIPLLLREYGYGSEGDFIKDAIERRILELERSGFLTKVKAIRRMIDKAGLSELKILEDFDVFYHRK